MRRSLDQCSLQRFSADTDGREPSARSHRVCGGTKCCDAISGCGGVMKKGSSYPTTALVLGLMIVSLVAHSAVARPPLSCQLDAWQDMMPRVISPNVPDTAPRFAVQGKCAFPTPGFSVELKPHIPPSRDPDVLLLDAIVNAPSDPVPQVVTEVPVRYVLPGSTPPPPRPVPHGPYKKVIILPDKLVLTIKTTY